MKDEDRNVAIDDPTQDTVDEEQLQHVAKENAGVSKNKKKAKRSEACQ